MHVPIFSAISNRISALAEHDGNNVESEDMAPPTPLATPPPSLVSVSNVHGKGRALLAKTGLKKGQRIFRFQGDLRTERHSSEFALQIWEDIFLESNEEWDNYLNHSCNPNCYVEFLAIDEIYLVAVKQIPEGEELTFDYETTEWDLFEGSCQFECHCQSHNCRRDIVGFTHLSLSDKLRLLPYASPYLQMQLAAEPGLLMHPALRRDPNAHRVIYKLLELERRRKRPPLNENQLPIPSRPVKSFNKTG